MRGAKQTDIYTKRTGGEEIYEPHFTYHGFRMEGFFSKWVPDVRDSQADDGRYPNFAPMDHNRWKGGTPAWADAGTVVPWRMYQNYGDTRMLAEHYESARRWVDFAHSKNPSLLWEKAQRDKFNDWLNGDTLVMEGWPKTGGEVPPHVLATAFFAHSTEIVAKMAAVTGPRIRIWFNRMHPSADPDRGLRIDFTDERQPILSGAIGVRAHLVEACFDNILVLPVDVLPQSPTASVPHSH